MVSEEKEDQSAEKNIKNERERKMGASPGNISLESTGGSMAASSLPPNMGVIRGLA